MADAAEQQEQHSPKPKSKLPFIVGGFLVLLLAIGAISMTLLGGAKKEGAEVTAHPTLEPPGFMFTVPKTFNVNLAAPDESSILSTEVILEIKPRGEEMSSAKALEEAKEELGVESGGGGEGKKKESNKSRLPTVTQIIFDVLHSKSKTEATSATGIDRIRRDIKTKINAKLEKAEVIEVYMQPLIP